ncbi:MAG: hypothetical protein M1541_18945 [Acidobacteria bacterium]|nr:hypothetical protein [Acidobacteriota bacterium]
MKTIVVAGDPVWERHLVPDTPQPAWIKMWTEAGGAWRLARLVRSACSDLQVRVVHCDANGEAANRYAAWALFEQTAGSRIKVWRVREFLGTEPPQKDAAVQLQGEVPNPELLVLDDTNLGIREDASRWPLALQPDGDAGAIVWRTGAPIFESALAERLLSSFAARLTAVIPVDALRARRAAIARALSWDRAVEETVREMESGVSARDLAELKRVIVTFGTSGAAMFSLGRLERLVFDPDALESSWESKRPGLMQEQGDILAAAVARHELQPADFPMCLALCRALVASRARVERGGGPGDSFDPSAAERMAGEILHAAPTSPEPARGFFTSVPHHLLDETTFKSQPARHSDLLRDVTGAGYEYVLARAADVVLRGPSAALTAAPRAKYAKYFTVDREEIERMNAVRNTIDEYRKNQKDARPLSLAVFGPPWLRQVFRDQTACGGDVRGQGAGSGVQSLAVRECRRSAYGFSPRARWVGQRSGAACLLG